MPASIPSSGDILKSHHYTIITLLISAFLFLHWRWKDRDDVERIYYVRTGGVYCVHREMTWCGIELSQCADTHVYRCLHDVHWEDR